MNFKYLSFFFSFFFRSVANIPKNSKKLLQIQHTLKLNAEFSVNTRTKLLFSIHTKHILTLQFSLSNQFGHFK